MIKKWIWIAVAGAVALGGFYYIKQRANPNDGVRERTKIGLSIDSLAVERWKRDMETFVAYATENGMAVDVQIANDNVTEQKRQIQYLIDEEVEALVILPKEKGAYTELIRQARRKGIYVIAYDRLILGTEIDAYIAFENVGVGQIVAERLITEFIAQEKHQAQVVIINGAPEDNNSKQFNEGFYKAIDLKRENIQINVLVEDWAPGWRESYAREALEKVLDSGVVPDGVIAANDALGTEVVQVLSERQLADKVLVVSGDAELSACQRIVEGTQLATVYKPINLMAHRAVTTCMELIGNVFEPTDYIPNGAGSIPLVKIEGQLVDKQTIDQVIIESGFHSREDVYRHVEPGTL